MLNYRFDITLALTRHHPRPPHPPAADSVCSSLPPFSSLDEPLLPENRSAFLLLPDQVISFIGLLVFPQCFFFSSFLWRFLHSFPGLRDGLRSCLQINSRGEIGTFRKQRSVPVCLRRCDVAVPDDKDCCICWVAAHKQCACFNCVWLTVSNAQKQGELRYNLA